MQTIIITPLHVKAKREMPYYGRISVLAVYRRQALGRKHDGEPGVLTLWRGYQRLQDLMPGYYLTTPGARRARDPSHCS